MSYSLAAYFSHSWKTHLPLHLAIWKRLHGKCHLLIDKPVQQTRDSKPPYYISRIESILRRSDAFVACLPAIDAAGHAEKAGRGGDWRLRCSPYILFEIRLAERADLPRCILYDPRTGFQPPVHSGSHARYIAGRLDEISLRVENNPDDAALHELDRWLEWVEHNRLPGVESDHFRCGLLLGEEKESQALQGVAKEAIANAGLGEPVDVNRDFRHDSDMLQTLRSLKLLVADVASPSMLPLYHAAHALMVPCVRLHSRLGTEKHDELPRVLRGHPAGYQEDLLTCEAPETVFAGICQRVEAVVGDTSPIDTLHKGNYELQQRAYRRHVVFISHDLKGEGRELVDQICKQCEDRGIDYWEYDRCNRAGENWPKNMEQALERMTIFVALETPTYDASTMCLKEAQRAKERLPTEDRLPFRLLGRASPVVALRGEDPHHEALPSNQSPTENVAKVVENILRRIRRD